MNEAQINEHMARLMEWDISDTYETVIRRDNRGFLYYQTDRKVHVLWNPYRYEPQAWRVVDHLIEQGKMKDPYLQCSENDWIMVYSLPIMVSKGSWHPTREQAICHALAEVEL